MASTVRANWKLRRSITKMFQPRLKHRRCLCTNPPAKGANLEGKSLHKVSGLKNEGAGQYMNRFSWLSQHGPQFLINGDQVQVITEPAQFYQILKLKSRKAKRRITFASLYLGTGELEQDLVSSIREACHSALASGNPGFEVNILLDYTRGSRGERNSRSMLRPLMAEFSGVKVSLFHTPDLRGIMKKIIPDRFNETIGLTHIKIYIFDDSFIISGANLSNDYFTNRQDRYILFNDCPDLADFFNNLVKAVMSFSLSLSLDNTLSLAPDWNAHPYKESDGGLRFKVAAREKIQSCLRIGEVITDAEKIGKPEGSNGITKEPDTVVYPLVQMGPFGIVHDEQAMLNLLRGSESSDNILLASGYFNLTDHYMAVILDQSLAKYSILMASPQANGFLGAKGLAGAIPYSYIYLAYQFYKRVTKRHQADRIHMMEYFREGWTFHGKGLWYYLPSQALPSLTLVGSPNFGHRSVYKDLECQVAIVTENKNLQEQLREEHVHMYSSSQNVTEATFQRRDRYVPLWTRLVTNFSKHFF